MMNVFRKLKLLAAFFVLPLVSSCLVDASSGYVADSSSLVSFSSNLMTSYMLNPARRLFDLLSLDEYLKLPESEQEKSDWHSLVYRVDENTLDVVSIGTVITGGMSITSPGSSWEVEMNSYGLSRLDMLVTCVNEGEWALMIRGAGSEASVTSEVSVSGLTVKEKSLYCVVSCTGSQVEAEYVTEFASRGERFVYDVRFDPYVLYLSGQFNVNIFKGNNMIDYCYMTYSGRGTSAVTSRD